MVYENEDPRTTPPIEINPDPRWVIAPNPYATEEPETDCGCGCGGGCSDKKRKRRRMIALLVVTLFGVGVATYYIFKKK